MAARGPKSGRWGLEIGQTLGYWILLSTFAIQVFDLSTPSMRKVDDREKKKIEEEKKRKIK